MPVSRGVAGHDALDGRCVSVLLFAFSMPLAARRINLATRGASSKPRRLRILDLGLASLGLLGVAPTLVLAGLAIKVDLGGPVFIRQRRIEQATASRSTFSS